jgi:hypothetical protein
MNWNRNNYETPTKEADLMAKLVLPTDKNILEPFGGRGYLFDAIIKHSIPSNLITTALNHGIGVTKAHRALSDCQLIAELFDRTEDLQGLFERAIARANEPRYLVIAQVSFDQQDLAKSAGFYWQPDGKLWVKELRESDLNIESSQWQFKFTTEIKND